MCKLKVLLRIDAQIPNVRRNQNATRNVFFLRRMRDIRRIEEEN